VSRIAIGVWRASETEPVEILFIASRSQYIKERTWHPSQVLTSTTEGNVKLKLQVGITPQLVCWILGFGSDAKVLGPAKLQDLVCKAAQEITASYPKKAG